MDTVSAYNYDGEGQRVRKLVGENTRFVYDIGGKLIAEFDASSGSLKKEYVYGGASTITIEPTAVNSNGTSSVAFGHKRPASLPLSLKSRILNMNWCCAAFEGWYGQAGERGIGILVDRDSVGDPEFVLQYRALEQGQENLLSSEQPMSLVVDVRLQYCPWCGRNLVKWYAPYVDKLFRPHLRIGS